MKNFSIICESAHEFDGWFASSESLLKQIDACLVECPYCGSTAVRKMLSAPQLSTPKTQAKYIQPALQDSKLSDDKSVPVPEGAEPHAVAKDGGAPNIMAMRLMLKHIQQTVTSQFKNVGAEFASEARKIHAGEIEAENIYGQCTEDERAELQDEGIDVFALPDIPKDN